MNRPLPAAALFLLLSAQAPPPAPLPDAPHVLAFLNRTIAWAERLDTQAQLADQPTDVLYVNDDRQLAKQVVALSFEAVKAETPLLTLTSATAPQQAGGTERMQRLAKRATSAAEVLHREQVRAEELKAQLAAAAPAERARLEAAVAEAQSRVAVAQVRSETVSGIAGFVSGAGGNANATDLPSQVAALEQTVSASTAAVSSVPHRTPASSVVGLIGDLIHLNQKSSALSDAIRAADVLQREGREFTAPLMGLMTQSRQRMDALLSAPDSRDPAELLRRRNELDALAIRFRQLSAVMLPLAKRRILLDAYKANIGRWRVTVAEQHREELRRLLFRAIALGILLFLVFAIAVIWRRVTFRYVPDVKRRHHFLLIRRIVLLLLVAGILTATFASDFSSLTTFVGLLTAGIAIALQDVILSMAGYFVIIGKYGIRVGDRVRIAAVNGDVLDVGLVWIYLMELEMRGSDQLPTGRIVEFPNSVVFDHSAGIFKQLPGTRFLWHEVSLTVPAGSDYRALQQRILSAVESVFHEYGDAIAQQHRDMDRLLSTTTPTPRPHTRLRVASTGGIEIRTRYPVEIERAGDIDDRVAAAVAAIPSESSGPGRLGGAQT